MGHISIMRFDKEVQKFHPFGSNLFKLKTIPRIGEKIVFQDEASIIAEVIDLHYSVNGDVDVYIGFEVQYSDYLDEMNNHSASTRD